MGKGCERLTRVGFFLLHGEVFFLPGVKASVANGAHGQARPNPLPS